MHQRYADRSIYFKETLSTTSKYVVPWILKYFDFKGKRVLEIGCGEGGNLPPFEALGCEVVGVDIDPTRHQQAIEFTRANNPNSRIRFVCSDALDLNRNEIGTFDLIILKDFIEHIDRKRFLPTLRSLLSESGVVFIAFPPWLMPYGGHQQVCRTVAGRAPWLHLLPKWMYTRVLRMVGEPEELIRNLEVNYSLGTNIEPLVNQLRQEGFKVREIEYYLINPGYEAKFDLNPRSQLPILRDIPWLRNFYTTCCYILVEAEG